MSYWDLWDNFAKIKENWTENKDFIYYFIEFLTHKTEVESDYANGLLRLTRAAVFNRSKNTLDPSFRRLQTICSQQRESLLALISHQSNDLIPFLKSLTLSQEETIKSKLKICSQFEYDLKRQDLYLKQAKDKYFQSCESSLTPSKKEEDLSKKYSQAVEDFNKFLSSYEETMKNEFGVYQNLNEIKYQAVQDSLRKLVIYQMSYLRSTQYEVEMLPNAIDSISSVTETKKFVSDNLSERVFKKALVEVHPKRINYESNLLPKGSIECLEKIFDKCWKGVVINDEDNKHFHDIIAGLDGRKAFSNKLNEKKIKEEFFIPSCTFGIVCGLFSSTLDKILEFQDVVCARQILFLSQCFYEETLSQKTFLHQILLTHPLWEDFKIWSKMIITSVEAEIETDSKICPDDNLISQALKLRPVLSSKISSYAQQMKNFMVESMVIEKTLKLIQEYYSFSVDVSIKAKIEE